MHDMEKAKGLSTGCATLSESAHKHHVPYHRSSRQLTIGFSCAFDDHSPYDTLSDLPDYLASNPILLGAAANRDEC
jgi:hypothetical protein